MYIGNVTNDYDDMTDDYKNTLSSSNNCLDKENNIDVIIPALLFKKPCGLSFLCLMSLMVNTLTKSLLRKE